MRLPQATSGAKRGTSFPVSPPTTFLPQVCNGVQILQSMGCEVGAWPATQKPVHVWSVTQWQSNLFLLQTPHWEASPQKVVLGSIQTIQATRSCWYFSSPLFHFPFASSSSPFPPPKPRCVGCDIQAYNREPGLTINWFVSDTYGNGSNKSVYSRNDLLTLTRWFLNGISSLPCSSAPLSFHSPTCRYEAVRAARFCWASDWVECEKVEALRKGRWHIHREVTASIPSIQCNWSVFFFGKFI